MTAKGLYFNSEESHGRATHSTLILVEGVDDAYFIDKILTELEADQSGVRISVAKGRGNIPNLLNAITLSASYKLGNISRIIIVTDADHSEAASIRDIHAALSAENLPTPQAGTFESNGAQEVGLLIIPGNGQPGELAHLLLAATTDPRLLTITECFDSIVETHGALPRPSRSKRIAHMYMQVRPEDCRGIGRAYALGAFVDDTRINEIRSFLNRVV